MTMAMHLTFYPVLGVMTAGDLKTGRIDLQESYNNPVTVSNKHRVFIFLCHGVIGS